ncbi:hypothetical protein F2Q70_00001228 [Brassica cretica]|uniref:Uncharacterized protein n=1 Tax=Brassica cretica TaxID=69181 RepID=A0A8S9IZE4_BRACR|nr:hypothetical protein F2Q70_00001228 [Brassica cretica]
MSSEVYYRSWMDKPHLDPNTNLLTEEYVQGIGEFMRLVQQQPDAKSGFSRNYKVWYLHGETGYEYGSTSEPQPLTLAGILSNHLRCCSLLILETSSSGIE